MERERESRRESRTAKPSESLAFQLEERAVVVGEKRGREEEEEPRDKTTTGYPEWKKKKQKGIVK